MKSLAITLAKKHSDLFFSPKHFDIFGIWLKQGIYSVQKANLKQNLIPSDENAHNSDSVSAESWRLFVKTCLLQCLSSTEK